MRLQWWQLARRAVMAGVIPGQNTVDSAHALMEVTPWWAQCSTLRMCGRRVGGMTILSLYITTPSMVYR